MQCTFVQGWWRVPWTICTAHASRILATYYYEEQITTVAVKGIFVVVCLYEWYVYRRDYTYISPPSPSHYPKVMFILSLCLSRTHIFVYLSLPYLYLSRAIHLSVTIDLLYLFVFLHLSIFIHLSVSVSVSLSIFIYRYIIHHVSMLGECIYTSSFFNGI